MTNEHLSDLDIQLFVFDKDNCEARIADHIRDCPACAIKAGQYNMLSEVLAWQEKPVFEFDLASTVMDSLPAVKPKVSLEGPWVYVLGLAGVAAIAMSIRLLQKTGLVSTALIGTTMVCVLAFLLLDMYRVYQKQEKLLSI